MSAPLSILDYRQPVDFRMGDVIVRSWTILSRHFLTFAVLVGVAQLLPLVLSLYLLQSLGSAKKFDPSITALVASGGIGVIQFILSNFAQAIVIFAAFQDLRGRPVNAGESLQQGLARVFPAILAAILTVLLVVVTVTPGQSFWRSNVLTVSPASTVPLLLASSCTVYVCELVNVTMYRLFSVTAAMRVRWKSENTCRAAPFRA